MNRKILAAIGVATGFGLLAGCEQEKAAERSYDIDRQALDAELLDDVDACADIDALVSWWEIAETDDGIEHDFALFDTYEIFQKNNEKKYYFSPKGIMTARDEWKEHKDKDYKLELIETDDACAYLCVGLKLDKHGDAGNQKITHFIAFQPPIAATAGQSRVRTSDVSCEETQVHGGTAHAQN